jgi:hypothetical protein
MYHARAMSARRCPHGLDARFCALCSGQRAGLPARPRAALGHVTLDEILRFLNAEHTRATYGAVGQAIGMVPRAVGAALGHRRPEASWVVNAANGLPTDYAPGEVDPALFTHPHVITTGRELLLRMAAWKRGGE